MKKNITLAIIIFIGLNSLIFSVIFNINKNFLYIKLIPESSVHIKEAETTIYFLNESEQEIKLIKKKFKNNKIVKIYIPKGAYSFCYIISHISHNSSQIQITGTNRKWLLSKKKLINIYVNDPINNINTEHEKNNITITWDPEENADLYVLNITFRDKDNITLGKLNLVLFDKLTSFDFCEIPNLLRNQKNDYITNIKQRKNFCIGKIPKKDFKKILVNVEGMVVGPDNVLLALTNAYIKNHIEFNLNNNFFEQ